MTGAFLRRSASRLEGHSRRVSHRAAGVRRADNARPFGLGAVTAPRRSRRRCRDISRVALPTLSIASPIVALALQRVGEVDT